MKGSEIALAVVAVAGIGYVAYSYLTNGSSSTSVQPTGPTSSIGQATPYETTGHLEDPLINELLNAIQGLGGITGNSSPGTSTATVLPSTSTSSPIIFANPTTPTIATPSYDMPMGSPVNLSTSPLTTSTSKPLNVSKLPLSKFTSTPSVSSSSVVSTGLSEDLNNAIQIQKYNPYYKPPTKSQISGTSTVSTTSSIGAAITGFNSDLISSAVKAATGSTSAANKAVSTYLNVTRPVVTTVEAVSHPVIQAVNQASTAVQSAITTTNKAISSASSDVASAAASAATNAVNSISSLFSHL